MKVSLDLKIFWKFTKFMLILLILGNILLYFYEDLYFNRLNKTLFGSKQTLTGEEKVMIANKWIYNNLHQVRYEKYSFPKRQLLYLYYRLSPMLASISGQMTVEFGTSPHTGPCGSLSRVLKIMLDKEGINNRRFLINDETDIMSNLAEHTLLEVQLSDSRYAAFDPTFNLFWKKYDGSYATKEDLRIDPILFEKGLHNAGLNLKSYPYRFDDYRYMRWERVPLGVPITLFIRDHFHVNFNYFPGFQFYDRSNLFLAIFFSFSLVIILIYETVKNRLLNGYMRGYFFVILEIAFVVCVIPAFFSYQLLKNEHFTPIVVILFNMAPGLLILYVASFFIFKSERKQSLFLLLLLSALFFILNLAIYVISRSLLFLVLSGNFPALLSLMYLRDLKYSQSARGNLFYLLLRLNKSNKTS